MAVLSNHIWKRSPFLRILLPYMAGILLQWHYQLAFNRLLILSIASLIGLAGFLLLPFFQRYRLSVINGILISCLFVAVGAIATYEKDTRHLPQWFGNFYTDSSYVVASIIEPPVEKTKSLKAEAVISYVITNQQICPAKGRINIYFQKDSSCLPLYGQRLIIKKPLQTIKNTGNPGCFDYQRYSLFHGITHQVYLLAGDFELIPGTFKQQLARLVFSIREKVLLILRRYIKNEKQLGLAEALLIGYKEDLDQSLVQSYSNTGVVHIIAISGLHLGLIYWLLIRLFRPLSKKPRTRWLASLIIITCLWLFSLLAGAQPSVLRSALMFTCILLAELLSRRTNIYNSLALSAFILLCVNPFWLWDPGFQLSFTAVLSLVLFMRPIYGLFFFNNKLLDRAWQLNAVTIAAQILTFPLCIYYFHQFPNYFLLTNLLAIPLSSIILLLEIFLCAIALIPFIALYTGKLLQWLIWCMNTCIEKMEAWPFALWDNLQINTVQFIALQLYIACCSYWLARRSINGLKTALLALLAFNFIRTVSFYQASRQQKMIIYNIPGKSAIDFVAGRNYYFLGDSSLTGDKTAVNFHLRPGRVLHRIKPGNHALVVNPSANYITWNEKRLLSVSQPLVFANGNGAGARKQEIDILLLSKNASVNLRKLAAILTIRQVVVDGSILAWRKKYWKKDCDSLGIAWHDVTVNGAFVMNMR